MKIYITAKSRLDLLEEVGALNEKVEKLETQKDMLAHALSDVLGESQTASITTLINEAQIQKDKMLLQDEAIIKLIFALHRSGTKRRELTRTLALLIAKACGYAECCAECYAEGLTEEEVIEDAKTLIESLSSQEERIKLYEEIIRKLME
jgi:hypothetical protein